MGLFQLNGFPAGPFMQYGSGDDVATDSVIHPVVERTHVPAVLYAAAFVGTLSPGSGLGSCFEPDIVLGVHVTDRGM